MHKSNITQFGASSFWLTRAILRARIRLWFHWPLDTLSIYCHLHYMVRQQGTSQRYNHPLYCLYNTLCSHSEKCLNLLIERQRETRWPFEFCWTYIHFTMTVLNRCEWFRLAVGKCFWLAKTNYPKRLWLLLQALLPMWVVAVLIGQWASWAKAFSLDLNHRIIFRSSSLVWLFFFQNDAPWIANKLIIA